MKKFSIPSPCDGMQLSCLLAEPSENVSPKGIVQLVHGMCEHKERYIPFMEFLAANGYVSVINDHRGHGASVKSPEDLGFMGKKGWSFMVDDTKAVTDWVRERYPGLKLTLFGHSMGSMVVRSYAKRYDDSIDMLYVCGSPSDNPAKGAGRALAAAFGLIRGWHCRPQLLQKMSFGEYNKPFAKESPSYPSAWVCSDPKTLADYHSDPLCQFVFTADGFYNLMCLMQDCYSPRNWAMKNPSLPVHFISGELDPCRASEKALRSAVNLMKRVGYAGTDLKTYPGMRHEILNETEKDVVFRDILNVLDANC
ncbi:MAG: lysophospholipase [Bacteroidales bacterium]|nr:lysophospholipase [Bacteroidales bacterium]